MKPVSTAMRAIHLHVVGVGVAAQVVVGLEQRDVVLAIQPPGAGQPAMPEPMTAMRMSVPRLGQHPLGDRLEPFDQAQRRHRAQPVPGQVDLPPAEALADGAGKK
jgi:hypothetical protein